MSNKLDTPSTEAQQPRWLLIPRSGVLAILCPAWKTKGPSRRAEARILGTIETMCCPFGTLADGGVHGPMADKVVASVYAALLSIDCLGPKPATSREWLNLTILPIKNATRRD